jgi:hypothetical protein
MSHWLMGHAIFIAVVCVLINNNRDIGRDGKHIVNFVGGNANKCKEQINKGGKL